MSVQTSEKVAPENQKHNHLGYHSRVPETSNPNQTIGKSGRQGIRTLITIQCHALAMRPGKPYPATFHVFIVDFQWSTGESNPDLLYAKQMSSRWTSTPFLFFFSTPPRIRTLTHWFGISSATVTPRAFIHQFFVFVCLDLISFSTQNFSGSARNCTSRLLPHN